LPDTPELEKKEPVKKGPSILPLARKLLSNRMSNLGAFPCIGFTGLDDYAEFLAPFNIFVVQGENGAWAL
jgi:hypothetical protein